MNIEKLKDEIGFCILPSIVSAILILGGLFMDWFWVQLFGWIIAVYLVTFVIAALFTDSGENASGCGCLLLIIFFIGLVFFHEKRYIAAVDNKQHLYPDCVAIAGDSTKQCSEFECFLRRKYSDCEICKNRRREEDLREEKEQEEKERQELIGYLRSLINRLENGATADEIYDELKEEFTPEVDEDNSFLPFRYR